MVPGTDLSRSSPRGEQETAVLRAAEECTARRRRVRGRPFLRRGAFGGSPLPVLSPLIFLLKSLTHPCRQILFMHFPRRVLAAGGGAAPPLSSNPSVVCLPLHSTPSPAPSGSTTSNENEHKIEGRGSSSLATLTTPTPVPLVLSLGPGLGSVVVPPVVAQTNGSLKPTTTTSGDTPSATVDALVSSLAATTTTTAAAGAGSKGGGAAAKPTDLGSGQAALHAELETQQELARQEADARANNKGETAGRGLRRVTVDKAAIGACRSRGTAELGETVFVVASWSRGGGGLASGQKERRGGAVVGGEVAAAADGGATVTTESVKPDLDATATVPTTATTTIGGGNSFMAEDDFALMVDFSSLDEAFGGGSGTAAPIADPTIVPPPSSTAVASDGDAPKPNQNGAVAGMVNGHDLAAAEQSELDEALAEWEGDEDAGGNSKWRVELTEVRVEMLNSDGPRACSPHLSLLDHPPLLMHSLTDS